MGPSLARIAKPASVIAVVGLLVAGGAYALAAGGSGKITACVSKRTGVLFIGKCGKHARKLTWNVAGRPGAPGAPGARGPQGPGASILTYDASASATPTKKTLGSLLGVTYSADCTIPASGESEATLFVATAGATIWDLSDAESENGTNTAFATHLAFPKQSTPGAISEVEANSGNEESDHHIEIIELAPEQGFVVIHDTATTTSSPASQTCHVSVLGFPTGSPAAAMDSDGVGAGSQTVAGRLHRML